MSAIWLWALGCTDRDPAVDTPLDTAPTSHTVELGPGLVLVLDALAAPVFVPCDEVRVVRVENRSAEEYVIDALTLTAEDEQVFGLAQVLEVPRIIRPGSALDIPMRVVAGAAATGRASVEVVSEFGTFDATFEVQIAWYEERTEAVVTPLPEADVVLTVDHSGAMTTRQAQIDAAVPQLLDALTEVADWRLILVTSDDGCNNGGVFTPTTPGASAWISAHAFDDETHGVHTESLLELASLALSHNAPSECNFALQRDHAQLHVITVSDGAEQSGRTWSYWVDDYAEYADEVRVSAVAALGGCGQADGYQEAAEATDGELVDLCDPAWGDGAGRLADAVDFLPPAFVLAEPAVPVSLTAAVEGAPVQATYDDERGAAVVPAAATPGTAVTLRYAIPATCSEATPGG